MAQTARAHDLQGDVTLRLVSGIGFRFAPVAGAVVTPTCSGDRPPDRCETPAWLQELNGSRPYVRVMTDLSEEDRRILEYLRDKVARGEQYVRSKRIADQLGLSPKQVGSRLPKLDEESEDVEIEKWARARSTTWRVSQS